MKTKIKSIVLLFTAAIIWGFSFVAQRVGADYLGAFTFNGIRFLLGAVLLLPLAIIFERGKAEREKLPKTLMIALISGALLFTALSLQQYGVEITASAGKSGFITALYAVLVSIMRMLTEKKPNVLSFAGAALAVGGLILLCMTSGGIYFGAGEIILLIGAFFLALYVAVSDRFMDEVSPFKLVMIEFLICGLISIMIAVMTEELTPEALKSAVLPTAYGGIMTVAAAFTCFILGRRGVGQAASSAIISTQAIFSVIGSALLLGEFMNGRSFTGCFLIFVGIIISHIDIKAIKAKKRVK